MNRGTVPVCLAAGIGVLLLATATPAFPKEQRHYSISVDVSYGEVPSRARYLEDLDRAVGSWLASTGPFGAPVDRGEAELHLQLTMHRVEIDRNFPTASAEGNVLFDRPRGSTETYSTLFDVAVSLMDPQYGDATIVEKRFTVFNEQGYTEFVKDPRTRSWEVNVEFLIDRVEAFLQKKKKKILKHLDQNPRLPADG